MLRRVAEAAALERSARVGQRDLRLSPTTRNVEDPPAAARRLWGPTVHARRALAGGRGERGTHCLHRVLHVQPSRVEALARDAGVVHYAAEAQTEGHQRLDAGELFDRLFGEV